MKPTGYGHQMTYDVAQLPVIMGTRRLSNQPMDLNAVIPGNTSNSNQNTKISSGTLLPSPHNAQNDLQVFRKQ